MWECYWVTGTTVTLELVKFVTPPHLMIGGQSFLPASMPPDMLAAHVELVPFAPPVLTNWSICSQVLAVPGAPQAADPIAVFAAH